MNNKKIESFILENIKYKKILDVLFSNTLYFTEDDVIDGIYHSIKMVE